MEVSEPVGLTFVERYPSFFHKSHSAVSYSDTQCAADVPLIAEYKFANVGHLSIIWLP